MLPGLLLALMGAMAYARPVPTLPEHDIVVPRELQYSRIAALSGAPVLHRKGSKDSHDRADETIQHSNEMRHHDRPYSHDGREPGAHEHFGEWSPHAQGGHHPHDFHHEFEHDPHGHGLSGGHHDIFNNIVAFLSHQTRSVPDVSSRVANGVKGFLAHEIRSITRDEEQDSDSTIIDNIMDFLAKSTK